MVAQLGAHPSADDLYGFAAGKLDDPSAAVVMNHLDSCPDCCSAVATFSGDDFFDRLRLACSPAGTPAPAGSLPGNPRGPKPATRLIADLPPELADHPQYEVLRELGRGGMGVVYLAKNKLMDRLEGVKVLNRALFDHPGAVERFLREIRSAAMLNHANIVAAYSALRSGELLGFAMEYVEGETLAELVRTRGPLPVAQACYYAQQAAQGLQHAFEKDMVHRDMKPQNLMLAREGSRPVIKVLDFGLAKVTRTGNEDTSLTDHGVVLGTPDYIAPEQTWDAANADIRADVYSLGCTLYYLLSGSPPFKGRPRSEVLQAHQSEEAEPLNLLRPDVPEELAAVVRKMMAKDPARRFQTPLALVQTLAAFVEPEAKSWAVPKFSPALSTDTPNSRGVEFAEPRAPGRETGPPLEAATQTESDTKPAGPRRGRMVRMRRPPEGTPTSKQNWLIGAGFAGGTVLIGLLGLWAGGVFRVKTPEGTLVTDVDVPNPDVSVDGRKMTVNWDKGRKTAEVNVRPGTGEVSVAKDGVEAVGERVTLSDGQHRVLEARLERPPRTEPGSGGRPNASAPMPKPTVQPPPPRGPGMVGEGSRAGEVRDDNTLKLKLCWCPTGTTPGFWIGKYEVTQSEWAGLMGSMPAHAMDKGQGDRFPIYYVSHADATEFCRKLTDLERKAGRLPALWAYQLPTDAQWEYACRAGTTTETAFGDKLDSTQANFNGDWPHNGAPKGPHIPRSVPVGSYPPNAWGIYDMHGNVGEFVAAPGRFRGGSWYDNGRNCCSGIFIPVPPDASQNVGFRVARVRD